LGIYDILPGSSLWVVPDFNFLGYRASVGFMNTFPLEIFRGPECLPLVEENNPEPNYLCLEMRVIRG
jgi:hypothetical protein